MNYGDLTWEEALEESHKTLLKMAQEVLKNWFHHISGLKKH